MNIYLVTILTKAAIINIYIYIYIYIGQSTLALYCWPNSALGEN